MEDELLTLVEAADIAQKAPISLRNAIVVSKTLPGIKKGNTWLVLRGDLEAWMNNPDFHKRGPRVKS